MKVPMAALPPNVMPGEGAPLVEWFVGVLWDGLGEEVTALDVLVEMMVVDGSELVGCCRVAMLVVVGIVVGIVVVEFIGMEVGVELKLE